MRVLLADDHAILRAGLRALLEQEGHTVVGEAANGREAIELTRRLEPELVVMDISMPDLNGIDATKRIVAESPAVKVLALSMHSDRRYVLAMFGAGAVGYLLKDAASDELIAAVDSISRSTRFVGSGIAEDTTADGSLPAKELSAREREVLQLIAEGCSSKDIGTRLQIALPTVETHRRQIMNKLGLRSVAELTKWAIREGLTPLER